MKRLARRKKSIGVSSELITILLALADLNESIRFENQETECKLRL
jgi:hypothetical protein